jgi:hypothetical protein
MVRRFLLSLEFALLGVLQVAWHVGVVVGLFPASAQTPTFSNPDTVQDFMADLPASDNGKQYAPDQALQTSNTRFLTAHRYYSERQSGARAVVDIINSIVPAFTCECEAKGGHLQRRATDPFGKTLVKIKYSAGSAFKEQDLHICTRSASQSLGAVAVQSTFHVSTSLWKKDFTTFTIVTLSPDIVITQAELDRDRTAKEEADRRSLEAYTKKLAEVEQWRRTIKPGTETSCGPVLRLNGEMVELVYYQTREPKWYRRSELWPDRLNADGKESCR